MSSLAERLNTERHRRFVGRTRELKLFESSLVAVDLPFHILHIFGPGGVGKTTLLGELTRLCKHEGVASIYIDGRNLEPSAASFLSGLRFLMGLGADDSPLQVLGELRDRLILIIDTYETLAPLDEWLREEFLPQLSQNTLIVLASRNPPDSSWRTDPGWQALLQVISLRNLSPEESRTYLTQREIPVTQHQAVLDFTHGHPLALSLVADVFAQGQDIGFQPENAPNVVKTLLERFVQEVPTPLHRMALEACAMVRLTTETLLTQII
jgi:ATP/maltotriose-dependent transcriptional regulator MalT